MAINDIDEYTKLVLRTAAVYPEKEKALAVFGLGLAGEAGEVVDLIKKVVGHGHPLTDELRLKLKKELGDVEWYLSALAATLDLPRSEILAANIEKLCTRYPDGFSTDASLNRKPTDT